MLERLSQPASDPILALMQTVRADERPGKLDLTVGVYRDAQGRTPVMEAVRRAEHQVLRDQTTKAYVGLLGDQTYLHLLGDLLLGPQRHLAAAQTPGGSGALRVLADLVRTATPDARIWLSDPTWPNHPTLFRGAGFAIETYPYFNPESQGLDFDAMLATLRTASPGDVVVLHGCCHNPTGCDLSPSQWHRLSEVLAAQGLVPLVDLAYAGLGQGFDTDTAGVKHLAQTLPEVLVAVSCSKNFGLYRDRVGAAFVLSRNGQDRQLASNTLAAIARRLYSMPPHHGAAIVAQILADQDLRGLWDGELAAMRERLTGLRRGLAARMEGYGDAGLWPQIAVQQGMFSLLGLSDEDLAWLSRERAVYLVPGGRINFAALREADIPALAEALMSLSTARAA